MLEVKGYKEAEKGMLKIVINIPSATDEALQKTADAIVTDARSIVPVRTGRLRNSIGIEKSEGGFVIKTDTPYSGFVEFGTSRMLARPYLRPAIQYNIIKFFDVFIERLKV